MRLKICVVAAVFAVLAASAANGQEPAASAAAEQGGAGPSAGAMLKEYDALRAPTIDAARRSEPEYAKSYAAEEKRVMLRRAELAREFYERHPAHERAGPMLFEGWMYRGRTAPKDVMAEARAVADRRPPVPARADAMFVITALNMMNMGGGNPARGRVLAEEFVNAYPKDPRSPMILGQLAETAKDPAEQKALQDRLAREFPDSHPARIARAEARRATAVGKPFELSFTDALTGKRVSMDDYKGKVVLIDFWATWCGPCVAQVPELKRLHKTYQAQGLEIIGVNLDASEAEGGLHAMKAFVEKNEMPWPQYYQGKHWAGEFSSGWGIRMVPTVFLVDRDGKLFTLQAGHALEPQVKQLLAVEPPG